MKNEKGALGYEQKNHTAKSFFVLEINTLQVSNDITDE